MALIHERHDRTMAEDKLKQVFDSVTDAVDDAISQSNYSDLSGQIADLVGDIAELAAKGFSSRGQQAARKEAARRSALKAAQAEAARKERMKQEEEEKRADRYFVRPQDASGSRALSVAGGIGTALFGCAALILGVFSSSIGGFAGALTRPFAVIAGILAAASIAMFVTGRKKTRKRIRYASYRKVLLPKLYADVKDIAVEMNLPEQEVVRDLEAFSKEGLIREGHFDDRKKIFIASNELYGQYRASVVSESALHEEQERQKKADEQYSAQVREILRKGNEYIAMIHTANDNIPDADITAKLNRMEEIVRRIFDEVRERPELADQLNMFMNYYLPTTTKLVNAYEEMDRQMVQGENIKKAKREIASSLNTISDAYEKLLDSFFLQQTEDVTSDINVMKMMMQQQGLTPDEMAMMRKRRDEQFAQAAQEAGMVQAAGGKSSI